MGSGQSCRIEIENECTTYILVNPRMYINSGYCATPFPPTVVPGATGRAEFRKHNGTATGCVGIVTYDLLNKDTYLTLEEIAVMFSVPYDLDLYSKLYAVGVFDKCKQCDKALYQKMYYDEPTTFSRHRADGSSLTYARGNITIKGTMSDTDKPVIKVQVSQN